MTDALQEVGRSALRGLVDLDLLRPPALDGYVVSRSMEEGHLVFSSTKGLTATCVRVGEILQRYPADEAAEMLAILAVTALHELGILRTYRDVVIASCFSNGLVEPDGGA